MPNDIKNTLAHTNIFKELNKLEHIDKIGSSKYKVLMDGRAYVFSLYGLEEYDNINNETYVLSLIHI